MNEQEIIEGNKMIAEFMGGRKGFYAITQVEFYTKLKHGRNCLATQLKYHSSWDWLMPVVEKIKSLYINEDDYCVFSKILSARIWESKENIWLAVIEFIKWYNQSEKNA